MGPRLYNMEKAKVYLDGLDAKLERKEELSLAEKRFLLETGELGYKALTFPDALTPAERNRIFRMPAPDEVTANIRLVTKGAMSTPDEMFQAALDDAEAMTTEELRLITTLFKATGDNIYESSGSLRWGGKLGRPGALALNALVPDRMRDAIRAAGRVNVYDMNSPRFKAWQAKSLAENPPLKTPEDHVAHFQRQSRNQELAAEKARRWEEYDVKLFAEAAESMLKLAAELEGEVCDCELCAALYGDLQVVSASDLPT